MRKNDVIPKPKYNHDEREKLRRTIREEWEKAGKPTTGADEFIAKLLVTLTKRGFTAPSGEPLSERGVRFQVHAVGLRFSKPKIVRKPEEPKVLSRPVEVKKPGAKKPEDFIAQIMEMPSLTPEQKLQMIKLYYEGK